MGSQTGLERKKVYMGNGFSSKKRNLPKSTAKMKNNYI